MARAAATMLVARGVGATLVDLVRAQPLDGDVPRALARGHRALLVLEDPAMAAGTGAAVQRALGAADAGRLRVLRAGRRAPRELADAALALLGARGGDGMASGGRDADPGGQ
jgi:deoxyxylulose-5-phosphate synthase